MPPQFSQLLGQNTLLDQNPTTTVTTSAAVASGNAVLVVVNLCNLYEREPKAAGSWTTDNRPLYTDASTGAVTVTDSAGNTYVKLLDLLPRYLYYNPAVGGNTFRKSCSRTAVFGCFTASALSGSSVITVTHPRGPSFDGGSGYYLNGRSVSVLAASGLTRLDQAGVYADPLNSYTLKVRATSGETTTNEELVLGILGWTNPEGTGVSPSPTESWNALPKGQAYSSSNRWPFGWGPALQVFHRKIFSKQYPSLGGSWTGSIPGIYEASYNQIVLTFAGADPIQEFIVEDSGLGGDFPLKVGGDASFTVTDSGTGSDSQNAGGGYPVSGVATELVRAYDRLTLTSPGITENVRLGGRVPPNGVNVAWVKIPKLLPETNLSLIDTASFIAENVNRVGKELLTSSNSNAGGNVYGVQYNAPPPSTPLQTWETDYQVTLDSSLTSGVILENFTSEIRVLHPHAKTVGPWYPQVQDGVIVRRHVLSEDDQSWLSECFSPGDTLVVYYTVPEASVDPVYASGTHEDHFRDSRVVELKGIYAEVVDERTLQLPHPDLVEVRSLKINGEEQMTSSALYIEWSDPNPDAWTEFPVGVVTSWDPVKGRLLLNRTLGPEDVVQVDYRYREYLHTFRGYVDDAGVYHDLNLNPAPGYTFDHGRPTKQLLNRPVYIYLLPSAAYRLRRSDGTSETNRVVYSGLRWTKSFLRWDLVGPPEDTGFAGDPGNGGGGGGTPPPFDPCRARSTFGYTYFGSAVFVSKLPQDVNYTPPSTGTVSGTPTFNGAISGLGIYSSAIILAKIYVTPNSQVENIELVDTRQRGGGIPLSVDLNDPFLPGATRREAETYWDIGGWDGQPVPLMGVLLVEVPEALLTGANGYPQFTHEEIEGICRQHVAAGVKVIIRYI